MNGEKDIQDRASDSKAPEREPVGMYSVLSLSEPTRHARVKVLRK